MNAAVRAREPDPEYNGQAPDLIFQGHALSDQLLARDDQRADGVGRQRLHVHGLEEPGASQMRQPSRVVAVGLVGRERLERLIRLPALYADHGKTQLAEPVEQDRGHSTCFEYDAKTNSLAIACAVDLPGICGERFRFYAARPSN